MTRSRHLDGDWWPEAIPDNVVIGERCYLYSAFAFQRYRSRRPVGVRIGDDTGIYEGTVFDLGPDGEVEIGVYATVVSPLIATNGRVVIGDYAFVSHDVFMAGHPAAVPPDAVAAAGRDVTAVARPIVLGDDVWVGTGAVLLAGATLGDGAIVGAGCVVDFPVPDYAVVAGSPARIVGWSPPRGDAPFRGVDVPHVGHSPLASAAPGADGSADAEAGAGGGGAAGSGA